MPRLCQMAIANFPKISHPSCFVPVYLTAMKLLPSNTSITSQVFPIIKLWTSLHKYSKKSLEERLRKLGVACPSTSSQQSRTWIKSVQNVEKPPTAHKIIGLEGSIQIWAKGNCPQKHQVPQRTIKRERVKGKGTGKGKEKVQESANVLYISGLPELSITSSESINFSCYKMSEKVEWYLDSGSTEHITPDKSNFIEYREFA